MPTVINTEHGKITITEDVIATAIGITVIDTAGLVEMATRRNVRDSLTGLLGRDDPARGVEVRNTDDKLEITLHIIVTYGIKIPALAATLRNKVSETLDATFGLVADQININVQGVKVAEAQETIIEE